MIEVLAKLNESVGYLQQRISYYEKLVKDTNLRAGKLAAGEGELVVKTENILAKEKALGPIGEAVAIRDAAIIAKGEAEVLMKSVKKDKDEFSLYKENERAVMAKDKHDIDLDRKKVNNELGMIQNEWKALDKEKKTWKDDFYKGLKNVAG